MISVLALSLLAAIAVMAVATVAAARVGRVSVVDVAWGPAFVAVAAVCAVFGDWPSWLLLAVVAAWGVRLAVHIGLRARGHGEDPRYVTHLGGTLDEVGLGVAIRKVFGLQAVAAWFVSLPLQAAAIADAHVGGLVVGGAAVAVAGLFFEAVGDAQLAAYKADPHRGPVMDRGLWAWTRHPNYFGDALFWTGLWLAGGAASGWIAALATFPSLAAMVWFLAFATGARLLEQTMMQRPGYPEYAARTSMFLPLPPKRGTRRARG